MKEKRRRERVEEEERRKREREERDRKTGPRVGGVSKETRMVVGDREEERKKRERHRSGERGVGLEREEMDFKKKRGEEMGGRGTRMAIHRVQFNVYLKKKIVPSQRTVAKYPPLACRPSFKMCANPRDEKPTGYRLGSGQPEPSLYIYIGQPCFFFFIR